MAKHDQDQDYKAMDRPPKPVPFGEGCRGESTGSSRDRFRTVLGKRRQSLTAEEHGFLQDLLFHGDDNDIAAASTKLNDFNLFFDTECPSRSDFIIVDSRNSSLSSINNNASSNALGPDEEDAKSSIHSTDANTSVSSAKRIEHLEARRNNDLHGKMWKAHESGLAVSQGASRKSYIRREESIRKLGPSKRAKPKLVRNSSFLSTATEELLLHGGPSNRPGESSIFRSIKSSISRSRRNRRKSIGTVPQVPSPLALAKQPLGRLRSKSVTERKSVTFKDDNPEMESKLDSFTVSESQLVISTDVVIGRPLSISSFDRRASDITTDSIPSIHHAHHIRSDSMSSIPSDSIGSISSNRRELPIRSSSISSIPSIHHARPIRSDSIASSLPSPLSEDAYPQTTNDTFANTENDPAWKVPLPQQSDFSSPKKLARHPAQGRLQKPVLLREASVNVYHGEGIEASEWNDNDRAAVIDSIEQARKYQSMLSLGSIFNSSSFDETKSTNRSQIFRAISRSLSNEEVSSYFLASNRTPMNEDSSVKEPPPDGYDESWDLESENGQQDAWNVLKDEYATDYGIQELHFHILGTSADDTASRPHVLSPPLMESLQPFFPYSISEDNFWMKFSLLRDGASLQTLLQKVRGSQYTVLALETTDGEVFGSFTSTAWRKNWNYFGSGESFLWRMRQSRRTLTHSIIDQALLESELDVYPFTGENNCIQLCTHDRIALGNGAGAGSSEEVKDHEYGFGLAIDADLLHGTSSICPTFGSPPLSRTHAAGEKFELMNVEVWTLTPCMTNEEAEKMELGKLFLESSLRKAN